MSLVPFMANEFYCPQFSPEKHRLNELMIQKWAFKVQNKHLVVKMVVYIAVSRQFINLSCYGLLIKSQRRINDSLLSFVTPI